MLKVSWRTTSDMAKPQFDDPLGANFTTVEASNGAVLEVWYDRLNIRPYGHTLLIRVGRGYLREGDTLTIRFGVYEVGPYSASMPKVEIPSSDLNPYLATPPTVAGPPRWGP